MNFSKSSIKKIPVPKSAKSVKKILENTKAELAPRPQINRVAVEAAIPTSVDVEQLTQPQGVWYSVERTRAGNLPVYTDYNNAGGVWTEVRKISGNAAAFKNDIKKILDLGKGEIWIQPTAQKVVIKGNHSAKVKQLLEEHF